MTMQQHDRRPIPAVPYSQGDRVDLEEIKSEPVKHISNLQMAPTEVRTRQARTSADSPRYSGMTG
jgi:hypothetical protein